MCYETTFVRNTPIVTVVNRICINYILNAPLWAIIMKIIETFFIIDQDILFPHFSFLIFFQPTNAQYSTWTLWKILTTRGAEKGDTPNCSATIDNEKKVRMCDFTYMIQRYPSTINCHSPVTKKRTSILIQYDIL